MTLNRYAAIRRAWSMHPPAHLLLAASLGYRAPAPSGPTGDFADFLAYFGVPGSEVPR